MAAGTASSYRPAPSLPPWMRSYDYLIVGAGLTGSVLAERLASQLDRRVLVVDRRAHVAGNAFDRLDEHGVRVHPYGPHLFHTNSDRVWQYLSRFTAWHPYEHRVVAEIEGQRVPVPFNLTSLHALFPASQADRLERLLVARYGAGAKVPIMKLRETAATRVAGLSAQDATDLQALADFIYEQVFYGYTLKQWDLTPEELGPAIMGRVPVHVAYDDRYFGDTYQALPSEGYTAMVDAILDHPNIDVETGVDFAEAQDGAQFDRLIYTGPIDTFFDHVHGPLPYRSLRFEFEHHAGVPFLQERAQVNFPNRPGAGPDYTRIVEIKHATGQDVAGTTLVREFPQAHVPGETEPYYPIPMDANRAQYARYAAEAAKLSSVTFAGRLADYKYYNMDQAVARALRVFETDVVPV